MASPTPGYCTLTATARSVAGVGVDDDGPVHLADRRRGDRLRIPLDEHVARAARRARARRPRRRARPTSAARRPAARRAPGAPARAGRRRGSWPSGRASSARPSCCRAARRPARRCAAGARRRARRAARPRRTACGRRSPAYVAPTATPRRASSTLRPARRRAADRSAEPARGGRRRPPRARRPRRRARGAATAVGGASSRRGRRAARTPATSTGTARSGRATTASWSASTRNAWRRRDRLEQLDLAAQRHDLVVHRDDDGRRHVDLAEPLVGAERADRPAGLEHHPPVVARRPARRPTAPTSPVLRCR